MSNTEWKIFQNIKKDEIITRIPYREFLNIDISLDEYEEDGIQTISIEDILESTPVLTHSINLSRTPAEILVLATQDIMFIKIKEKIALSDENNNNDPIIFDEVPRKRNLFMDHEKPNLLTIKSFYEDGTYRINSEYQRSYIWDVTKASRLIESLLLKIPIPTIYCSETEAGAEYEIIDGQQRVYTIYSFLSGKLRLKNLESLPMLNGLNIEDLEHQHEHAHKLLVNSSIPFIMITKESDHDIKFDVFMRINQGATDLNAQELRNCMYRGKLSNALKELRGHSIVRSIINTQEGGHIRFQDMELLVRMLAVYNAMDYDMFQLKKETVENDFVYRGNMKLFLNAYMRKNREMEQDAVDVLIKQLLEMLEIVNNIFADRSFRRPDKQTKTINSALVDIISSSFLHYISIDKKELLINNSEEIKNLLTTLCEDVDFVNAISAGTSGIKNINSRMGIWFTKLNQILKV